MYMKIAIISPSFLPVPAVKGGAIETLIQLFIDQNESENDEVNILVISAYDREAVSHFRCYKKTKFVWIKYQSMTYRAVNYMIRAIRRCFRVNVGYFDTYYIKRALKKQDFDKVIVEGNVMHAESIMRIVDKDKLYFRVHSNIINSYSKTNKAIIDGCGRIIVGSNFIKRMVMRFTGAHDNQIEILRPCIDLTNYEKQPDKTKREELRSRYGILTSDVVIIFVGRIVIEKGIIELVDALNSLPKQCPFKLIVIGSFGSKFGLGDSEYLLRKQIDNISCLIREKIVYTGYVPNSEKHLLYSIGDIGVVPSTCEDAAPLVPIEMMAAGLPLVITNSGGMPEYVNDDCAIIVNRDENLVKNIAISLERLIEDKELRKSMGLAGKKHAQQFSSKNYYDGFMKILQ